MKQTLAIILLSASCGWSCKANYVDGPAGACTAYMPQAEGASPDESAKWVSDEKPPRNPQPEWEMGGVHAETLTPVNPADEHHPTTCPNNCVWDGGKCDCTSDSGKKPN